MIRIETNHFIMLVSLKNRAKNLKCQEFFLPLINNKLFNYLQGI